MKKKYRWNVKKFMSNVAVFIIILFILWAVISWVDISIHNLSEGYTYSDFNLFKLIINLLKR